MYLKAIISGCFQILFYCGKKDVYKRQGLKQMDTLNSLNLKSVLGSHSINKDVGCYSYRATHWLDNELGVSRFFEILDRCIDEADRGYACLAV